MNKNNIDMNTTQENLEKSVELLKESLGFINYIKQDEGEIDDDNLEDRINEFLKMIGR